MKIQQTTYIYVCALTLDFSTYPVLSYFCLNLCISRRWVWRILDISLSCRTLSLSLSILRRFSRWTRSSMRRFLTSTSTKALIRPWKRDISVNDGTVFCIGYHFHVTFINLVVNSFMLCHYAYRRKEKSFKKVLTYRLLIL